MLLIFYQFLLLQYDRKSLKGITSTQFESTLRSNVAEAAGERAQKLIAEGNVEKLEQETLLYKRLYGDGVE